MSEDFLYTAVDGIATIAINTPEKLNALKTSEARQTILKLLREAEEDPSVKVVVLRGNGRAFSVGWDIGKSKWDASADAATKRAKETTSFFTRLAGFPNPR